ncbi:MAG: PAQR family membrane homeostasis protein TrhA [Rhizobiaceae bacterium]
MQYPSEARHERLVDGAVHALGIAVVTISAFSLMIFSTMQSSLSLIVACAVYCTSVLASFLTSAAYHLLPRHDWRRYLRRLDHTAIYALIAGTFTPLLVHIGTSWSYVVLAAVWIFAFPAMAYKLFGSVIEPRWSLASYLGLGWMGLFALPEFHEHLSASAVTAIFTGGLLYTFGTYFYAKKIQAYRYAIWHSFVLSGTAFFFFAVWTTVFTETGIAANM